MNWRGSGGAVSFKRLAPGAEAGAAVAELEVLERYAANRTGLSPLMGYPEVVVGETGLTAGTKVGAGAGSHVLDAGAQHQPDGPVEAVYLLRGEAAGTALRVDTGGEKGFVGIHIADTGDEILVDDDRLDGGFASGETLLQEFAGEAAPQRLRAEPAGNLSRLVKQPDSPEFPGVAEVDGGTIVEVNDGSRKLSCLC